MDSRTQIMWRAFLLSLLLPIASNSFKIDEEKDATGGSSSSSSILRPETCLWNPLGPLRPRSGTVCRPLVDDRTANLTGRWSPWTHRPVCLAGAVGSEQTRYCTFTSATFRRGRGLSVIGTPEATAGFAHALADPFVSWDPRLRPHIPGVVDRDEGPPYVVMEVPGKGKGVVARRLIRTGEILLTDHPVVIAAMDFPKAVGAEQGRNLLKLAVEQLPRPDMVFSLAGSTGGEAVEDILRTNTFGIGIDNITYMGLYPEVSRINHACMPNSFSRFHPSDLTMDVGAVRDIQPWEEVTISYIPLGQPSWTRAHSIRDWGFTCTCALCSSRDDNDLSDRYRMRINELRLDLANHEGTLGRDELAALSEELVGLVEVEGLQPHLGDYYETLSLAFEAKGDIASALRYERLSRDLWVRFGGEDHAHVPNVVRRVAKLERMVGGDGLAKGERQ